MKNKRKFLGLLIVLSVLLLGIGYAASSGSILIEGKAKVSAVAEEDFKFNLFEEAWYKSEGTDVVTHGLDRASVTTTDGGVAVLRFDVAGKDATNIKVVTEGIDTLEHSNVEYQIWGTCNNSECSDAITSSSVVKKEDSVFIKVIVNNSSNPTEDKEETYSITVSADAVND